MENKIKYGLSNVHYAVITESADEHGTVTYQYGTPKKINGAVELSMEAQGETSKKRADNMDYYVAISNNGYEGDLTMVKFPAEFKKDVLGEEKAANGVSAEYSNVKPKAFALLFQFEGDVNATKHVLYNCKCGRPDLSSKTTENSIEPIDEKIKITASPRPDYLIKGSAEKDATVYANWYKTVTLPGEAG